MRTIASWAAALILSTPMFIVVVGLAGGGHGWDSGAMACLWLMPVNVFALLNGFRANPSTKAAKIVIGIGFGVWLLAGIGTLSEMTHFKQVMGKVGILSALTLFLTCFQWLIVSMHVIRKTKQHESTCSVG